MLPFEWITGNNDHRIANAQKSRQAGMVYGNVLMVLQHLTLGASDEKTMFLTAFYSCCFFWQM